MNDYKVKYHVQDNGDSIKLLSVTPYWRTVQDRFEDGTLLSNIYLEDNGVFELRVACVYDENIDTNFFGIVSLEKLYGSCE